MTQWRYALQLAAKGVPVFPCIPGEKRPLTKRGLHDASSAAWQLREWARRWPRANLGLPTGRASGFLVVDVDCKAGVPGIASLQAAERILGVLPRDLISRTPSGGYHLWFNMPSVEIRNSAGKLGDLEAVGVDIRAEGGYVLIPPSRIGQGAYEWALKRKERPPVEPWEPKTEHEQTKVARWCTLALNGTAKELTQAAGGGRNHALLNAAVRLGSLLHYGAFSRDDVCRTLEWVCRQWGSPTPRKDRATIERGIGYGLADPKHLSL
jgi:hypothetical protein